MSTKGRRRRARATRGGPWLGDVPFSRRRGPTGNRGLGDLEGSPNGGSGGWGGASKGYGKRRGFGAGERKEGRGLRPFSAGRGHPWQRHRQPPAAPLRGGGRARSLGGPTIRLGRRGAPSPPSPPPRSGSARGATAQRARGRVRRTGAPRGAGEGVGERIRWRATRKTGRRAGQAED